MDIGSGFGIRIFKAVDILVKGKVRAFHSGFREFQVFVLCLVISI